MSSNAHAQPYSGVRCLILGVNLRLFLYYVCARALVRLRGCAGAPEPSLFAYAISTIIPCAGSNNAYVSWQYKALKEQIMHSFYDNAAYAIIIIIIKKNKIHTFHDNAAQVKKRTNNASFKEIHSTAPAKTQLSGWACPYNKNVAVLMKKKKKIIILKK